jgi:predicted nucleotidyltransferase
MIDLEREYLEIVRQILREHVPECEVRAFGSRVSGDSRRYSDLDLALVSEKELGWRKIESLKDAFSESDLPIIVDVVDWNATSEGFRGTIQDHCVVLQRAGASS